VPDGSRDRRGRKAGGGDLVEQRREQVVIGAVENGELDRRLAQRLRCPQAGEAAAEDQDTGQDGLYWK